MITAQLQIRRREDTRHAGHVSAGWETLSPINGGLSLGDDKGDGGNWLGR